MTEKDYSVETNSRLKINDGNSRFLYKKDIQEKILECL
ncbi:Uncharacterised protein [Streptococcus pneumoniae]|nr:Uncharacterised protein [Streptococcus pneumoniae]